MATWLNPSEARALWRDAPADDGILQVYLDAAAAAVRAYAPDLDYLDAPDESTVHLAQALQARNIYNGAKASPGGDYDGSSYGLSTFPLDWAVRQLLRPQRVIGAIA